MPPLPIADLHKVQHMRRERRGARQELADPSAENGCRLVKDQFVPEFAAFAIADVGQLRAMRAIEENVNQCGKKKKKTSPLW